MWAPMSQRGHRREAMGRGEKEGRGGVSSLRPRS